MLIVDSAKRQPTVTIVVPIYNVAPYLADCLSTIEAQSYIDFECVCVDDGSTDNGAEIVQEFCIRDSRFTLIKQANKGLAGARNAGISAAKGEYIFLLDSDDYLHPSSLSHLIGLAHLHGADVVCGFIQSVPELSCPENLNQCLQQEGILFISDEPMRSTLRKELPVGVNATNKLYKSSLLRAVPFDESKRIHEDTYFSLQILTLASRVVCTPSMTYFYRMRAGSLMNSGSYDLSIKSLADCALKSEALGKELKFAGPEMRELLRIGGTEVLAMVAVNLALNRALPGSQKIKLIESTRETVIYLRGRKILLYRNLSLFLSISMFVSYNLGFMKAYCRLYHVCMWVKRLLKR